MLMLTQENVMQDWKAQNTLNAMFHFLMNDLHRVEMILYFEAAPRNGDSLQAGEELSKLFFVMDRPKYKRR
jgi:hypothetical protein